MTPEAGPATEPAARPTTNDRRRRLYVDAVLIVWLIVGSLLYLRQFSGSGLASLRRLFGGH